MTNGVDLESVRNFVEQLRVLKDTRKKLEEAEKNVRAAIEGVMGDHEEGTLDGEPIISWKATKRNALNQKLLKDLYPAIWAECQDVTVVRAMRILG